MLPRQLTSFVGRDAEVAEVTRLLQDAPLVTLSGPGGVGKTRLALAVAGQTARAWPDGVWLAELAPLAEARQFVALFADCIVAREWLPVRNGIDPELLKEAGRAGGSGRAATHELTGAGPGPSGRHPMPRRRRRHGAGGGRAAAGAGSRRPRTLPMARVRRAGP